VHLRASYPSKDPCKALTACFQSKNKMYTCKQHLCLAVGFAEVALPVQLAAARQDSSETIPAITAAGYKQ